MSKWKRFETDTPVGGSMLWLADSGTGSKVDEPTEYDPSRNNGTRYRSVYDLWMVAEPPDEVVPSPKPLVASSCWKGDTLIRDNAIFAIDAGRIVRRVKLTSYQPLDSIPLDVAKALIEWHERDDPSKGNLVARKAIEHLRAHVCGDPKCGSKAIAFLRSLGVEVGE